MGLTRRICGPDGEVFTTRPRGADAGTRTSYGSPPLRLMLPVQELFPEREDTAEIVLGLGWMGWMGFPKGWDAPRAGVVGVLSVSLRVIIPEKD